MMSDEPKNPVRYTGDRPADCTYCYFWAGERIGCGLGGGEHCHYIDRGTKESASRCGGCPYGRDSPCIGWCTVRVMQAVLGNRKAARDFDPGKEVAADAGDPH